MGVDYKQLEKLQKQIEELQKFDFDAFVRDATNEIAQRFYAKVVKRTPVGQYPKGSGRVGGTLRRGWAMSQIKDVGDGYEVQIINPVYYAPYVNYGHRTRGGGWWEGYFFLEKTELEIEKDLPRIIERKLVKFLEDKLK